MALKEIKQEIETFIKSPTPQVLALSGAWGTGKTFLWQNTINALIKSRYAYISAAGCENINDLKTAILAQTGADKLKKNVPNVTIYGISISQIIKSGLGAVAELRTRDALICIDDLERAEKIKPYDILHYATWLRDEGNCKVVLLLNANQIDTESKEKFERTLEKGTNQFLKLNLTPKEAGAIFKEIIAKKKKHLSEEDKEKIFPEKWTESFLEITIELGICNIRVLEHLATALNRWNHFLKNYERSTGYEDLLKHIILGSIITGWGYFEPELCSKWEDLIKPICEHNPLLEIQENKENKTSQRQEFLKNLDKIKKENFNKIDTIIKKEIGEVYLEAPAFFNECWENILNGYLTDNVKSPIEEFIKNTQDRHEQQRIQNLFNIPQSLMFHSAGNITDELKKALKVVFEENPININLMTAEQFVEFSQTLSEKKQENDFIKKWTNALKDMPDKFFNVANTFGNDRISDDKLNWMDNRLLDPWKKEKNRRPNTFIKPYTEDAFIKHLKEKYINSELSIQISKEKWETILKNKIEPFYYKDVLETVLNYKNSHPELFQSLKEAIHELMKIRLYTYRFQTILEKAPDILNAYEIPKKIKDTNIQNH